MNGLNNLNVNRGEEENSDSSDENTPPINFQAGGASDEDDGDGFRQQVFVPLGHVPDLEGLFDEYFDLDPNETDEEDEEDENLDIPPEVVPSRIDVFLQAHPTGKDLCFTDAEMLLWQHFRTPEMHRIHQQWLGGGTMSIMVYRTFLTHPENKPLCHIHRAGGGAIENYLLAHIGFDRYHLVGGGRMLFIILAGCVKHRLPL
jgi:hypothetical protein